MPVSSASRNVWTVSRMSGNTWKKVWLDKRNAKKIQPLCICSSILFQESEVSSSHQGTSQGVPRLKASVSTARIGIILLVWFIMLKVLQFHNQNPVYLSFANLCCECLLHLHLLSIFVQTMVLPGLGGQRLVLKNPCCSHVHCNRISNAIGPITMSWLSQYSVHDSAIPRTWYDRDL